MHAFFVFFLMIRPPSSSTRTDTRFPYTTLVRSARTRADIELAKSGFQTAARLAPDLWEPMVGLAAAHYRLGEYRDALAALSEAVDRRGAAGALAMPYALVAYRAQPQVRIASRRGGGWSDG